MPVLKTRKGQRQRRRAREITITDVRRKRKKTTKPNIEADKFACILNLQSEASSRSLSDNAGVNNTRINVRKTLEHTIGQRRDGRLINVRSRKKPEAEDTKNVVHPAIEEPRQVMDRMSPDRGRDGAELPLQINTNSVANPW
jgi:hypothetical protein